MPPAGEGEGDADAIGDICGAGAAEANVTAPARQAPPRMRATNKRFMELQFLLTTVN
jgi:hypothetical protein